MDEILVRSVVNIDFRTDIWIDSLFHDPFAGVGENEKFTSLSTILHTIDVSHDGKFWRNDGYSYEASTQQDEDSHFAHIGVNVRGDLSPAFGGEPPEKSGKDLGIGPYRLGFKGSDSDWINNYRQSVPAEKVIFPPANVPAELAIRELFASVIASKNVLEFWKQLIPAATGIFSTFQWYRNEGRTELAGLPRRFDLLGIAIHMAQDVTIPHHTQSTVSLCHGELENRVDFLANHNRYLNRHDDAGAYTRGEVAGDRFHSANALYDGAMVEKFLRELPFLNPNENFSVSRRLRAIAKYTAQWQWSLGDGDAKKFVTRLPSGSRFSGDDCDEILDQPEVRDQLKRQYNLAVAASVSLFVWVEQTYEKGFLADIP